MADAPVLIAGAGPTGLAAALFLADLGVRARIVDPATEPSTTSKALAANPRTLDLLEPSGVAARMVAEGRAVHEMQLRAHGRVAARIHLSGLKTRFPMTAIPQASTEALLTEALAARGIAPERGVALETVAQMGESVEAGLRHPDGALETAHAPLLFGADGAHSVVRHALGVGFPGEVLEAPWRLADVEFNAPVTDSEGFIEFLPNHRFVFAMAFTPAHWRIIVVGEDPLAHLPPGATAKAVPWASEFKISHRIADRLSVGRVALGGDAAHLHSPMGARGMNLGVEDAWVFSRLAKRALDEGTAAAIADYGRVRREADAGVVRRVKLATHTVMGTGPTGPLREVLPVLAGRLPFLLKPLLNVVAGLDHPIRLA